MVGVVCEKGKPGEGFGGRDEKATCGFYGGTYGIVLGVWRRRYGVMWFFLLLGDVLHVR